jgi:hypothetical protein
MIPRRASEFSRVVDILTRLRQGDPHPATFEAKPVLSVIDRFDGWKSIGRGGKKIPIGQLWVSVCGKKTSSFGKAEQ